MSVEAPVSQRETIIKDSINDYLDELESYPYARLDKVLLIGTRREANHQVGDLWIYVLYHPTTEFDNLEWEQAHIEAWINLSLGLRGTGIVVNEPKEKNTQELIEKDLDAWSASLLSYYYVNFPGQNTFQEVNYR